MRLNKDKGRLANNKAFTKKPSNHLKATSMDNIPSSSRTKSIYLNKILQKNLGNNKISLSKDNIAQNFQSSIQSIFSNDEKRLKAKNYVLNLRNRSNAQPQYSLEEDFLSKNKNVNFSKSNYGEFYNKNNNMRKTYEILDDDDNYNYYRSSQKERPIFMRNILDNSPESKTEFIKVNKINKFNDEIRYFEESNNSNHKNNNLLNTTKQALNRSGIKNKNNLENNHIYLNSQNDINMNNSGYNEFGQDFINEFNQGNKNNNRQNEYNYEEIRYKSPFYNENNNKTKYSKGKINHNNMSKSKTNNNFSSKTNKGLYSKNTNINQKLFYKFNQLIDKKEDINVKKENKVFNNLKIAKNRLILKSKNNNENKNSFKKLISISVNKFNIKGNYTKKNTVNLSVLF